MRVAIVNQHPSVALGGSETQCAIIADRLARRGHEVRYVAVGGVGPDVVPGDEGAVRPDVVPVAYTPRAAVAAALTGDPDVVYWRIGTWGLRRMVGRARRRGVPVVLAASHVDDLRRWAPGRSARAPGPARSLELLRAGLRSWWAHGSLRRTTLVTVNNPDLLPLVQGVPVAHVPNAADVRTRPVPRPRPYVIWVANLKPAKRPETCIPLAEALAPHGIDVVMAGRIQTPGYERFERPELLPANLHFLGAVPQDEVNGLLEGALLHVHTCEPEGFPNIFIQAWMKGRPSVSLGFDPGGLIGAEGLGVDAGDDVGTFVAAVESLVLDEPRRLAAGLRARTLAEREFAPEASVRRVEEALVRAVQASPRGPRSPGGTSL